MAEQADDRPPVPAAPIAPGSRRIDLVRCGDRRLRLPQQVAHAATTFQFQFGTTPTLVYLSTASVQPPYPEQIAGVSVQVRPNLPPGYLWVAGVVTPPAAAPEPPAQRAETRTRRPGQQRRARRGGDDPAPADGA